MLRRTWPFVLAGATLAACASAPSRTPVLARAAPAPARATEAVGPAGFDPERLGRVADVVRGAVERGDYAGAAFLVLHDGRTASEGAFGLADADSGAPMRLDTIVRVYSMTKVVTCVAALQLMEEDVLRLDDPVSRWLPELDGLQVCTGGTADAPVLEPLTRPLTVRHLLNHTGGFTYDFFGGPVAELYQRADLWNATSMDDFLARVGRLPLVRQPGQAFDYGIGNDVLAVLVERAGGAPFEEQVARRITGPLGMEDTFFDVPAEKRPRLAALHVRDGDGLRTGPVILGAYAEPGRGFASGGAGLFSTLHDYARLAQCLLQGGTLDGARILGRKTVQLALQDSLPAGATLEPGMTWGLLGGVRLPTPAGYEPGSPGTLSWGGAATTYFFADPEESVVALVVAQHTPFDERGLFPRFRIAVYQALR
jgi:CubicO group peptidase (beta-lactamase class C family)